MLQILKFVNIVYYMLNLGFVKLLKCKIDKECAMIMKIIIIYSSAVNVIKACCWKPVIKPLKNNSWKRTINEICAFQLLINVDVKLPAIFPEE